VAVVATSLAIFLSLGAFDFIFFDFCAVSISKEKEISQLQQNADENGAEIAALQKRVRELEAKIEELEEDLENERNARTRVRHTKELIFNINNILMPDQSISLQISLGKIITIF